MLVPDLSAERTHVLDPETGRCETTASSSFERLLPDGQTLCESRSDIYTITEGDPLSAMVRCERSSHLTRGDWDVRIETVSKMTADEQDFQLMNRVDAYDHGALIASKTWMRSIPRDHN